MNVSLSFDWKIVVHDVSHVVDVDSTSCHIGCYKHFDTTFFEAIKRFCPRSLTLVSVNCGSSNTNTFKLFNDAVGDVFHLSKHNDFTDVVLFNDRRENPVLVIFIDKKDRLVDTFDGRLIRLDRDTNGIFHHRFRERFDRRRHRCGEK